ncbi:hypothetical protein EV401DRAFT_571256 [Pisolithus croceorrhizus]|nr:hypothetical protein EV401DRAFT_571256 [Pisolithus croceorrhizus]
MLKVPSTKKTTTGRLSLTKDRGSTYLWPLRTQRVRWRRRGRLETTKLTDVAAQGKSDEKFPPYREGWPDLSKCFAFYIVHDDQEIPLSLHHVMYARDWYSRLCKNELNGIGFGTVVGVSLYTLLQFGYYTGAVRLRARIASSLSSPASEDW